MESWTGSKRLWEEDSPYDMQVKRQGSTNTASVARRPSPLPPRAGYYSRDSQILSQRRLPPLYTPSCSTSAEPVAARSLRLSSPAQEAPPLDRSRPRSQSLFNVLHLPHWQRQQSHTEHPIAYSPTLELNIPTPPSGAEVHRPLFGTGLAPPTGAVVCCPPICQGQECVDTRTLMRNLAADLTLLDAKVRFITQTEHHSSDELPETGHTSTKKILQWAFDLVKWTNCNLQDHIEQRSSRSPETQSQPDTSPSMRRGQHHLEEREEQSPPNRQYPTVQHGFPGFTHAGMLSEDPRRNAYGSEPTAVGNSPHHTTSSSGSVFMPPQSPMQAPQPIRSAILPSPSSLNFPNVQSLPSISPPTASVQTSAQSAHLQDLQHQISVKTLAFQTLQREYDSLLQKLERQRTKCATLEKKFEVSDVEINSLTDEKEKLQSQVAMMESQVEELQQSRDEARRQLVANGAQYMRIMEMANRLQAQGAEDKKKWEAERSELEHRIRILEEAMVTGTEHPTQDAEHQSSVSPGPPSIVLAYNSISSSSSQSETISVLRTEVNRLRSRTQTLETALQSMRQESISIQTAARQLVESSGKLENVAEGALRGGG